MADIPKTLPPGGNADAGAALVWTAATGADQETAFHRGDLLLALNGDGAQQTVTVYSAPDEQGRVNNVTQIVAAGASYLFGPFPPLGWRQANGKLKFKATDTDVKFAVVRQRP